MLVLCQEPLTWEKKRNLKVNAFWILKSQKEKLVEAKFIIKIALTLLRSFHGGLSCKMPQYLHRKLFLTISLSLWISNPYTNII